jgi:hypothetical protein
MLQQARHAVRLLAAVAHGRVRRIRHLMLTLAAVLAIAIGLWQLASATTGLVVTGARVGSIPVTVYRLAGAAPGPAVVIAHGFAGSQQLMQPFAVTAARNGYVAVTFDFPGHGRNPAPLPGGLEDHDARTESLARALDAVVGFARGEAGSDGRVALLGHSMASETVVTHAQADDDVAATIAVSLFSPGVTAVSPRNLLVIDGALESSMLLDEGRRIIAAAGGDAARPGITYGRFEDGTARRLALSPGVEHIGVLYSRASMREALDWLDAVFERRGSGFVDGRGPWLGVLYAGVVLLGWSLARLLPRVSRVPLGSGSSWRRILLLGGAPALLTPLLLWKVPSDFLPLLLGDYLVLHFAVYGLLTAAGMRLLGNPAPQRPVERPSIARLAVAAATVAVFGIGAIGWPTDAFAFSFVPGAGRAWLVAGMLLGTLPYFLADEWLTRGAGARRGAYAFTKSCFLLSLMLAVALNLPKLFFLIIIVPAMVAFFLVYGLFSAWAYRRTGHPWVAGLANALAFAWAIAVTFPVVGR